MTGLTATVTAHHHSNPGLLEDVVIVAAAAGLVLLCLTAAGFVKNVLRRMAGAWKRDR